MKNFNSKLIIPIIVVFIAILAIVLFSTANRNGEQAVATSFEECVALGNAVMESSPRRCIANGQIFTEELEIEIDPNAEPSTPVDPGTPDGAVNADVSNMIRVTSPQANTNIKSPLVITGQARGNWFFEATFPVVLTNWDGLIIAEGYAQANGEWMTTEFVPFTATITFTKPTFNNRGFLILQKANASGLPQHDAALEIPIYFEGVAPQGQSGQANPNPAEQVACTMDAKMCPDGSYVGRQGPKCEFAPCPGN